MNTFLVSLVRYKNDIEIEMMNFFVKNRDLLTFLPVINLFLILSPQTFQASKTNKEFPRNITLNSRSSLTFRQRCFKNFILNIILSVLVMFHSPESLSDPAKKVSGLRKFQSLLVRPTQKYINNTHKRYGSVQ